MDYKRLHKETLTALQQMVSEGKITEKIARSICADFVKENEDERIRRELISLFQDCINNRNHPYNASDSERWLAWIEKQGEKKQDVNYPKFNFDDVLALQCCIGTVKKIQEDKELYEQLQSLHDRIHDAYWLEKQGEQEPEIKYIYPKFRVGDVIEPAKPNGYCVPVRVKYIGDGSYSCESDDHKSFLSFPICNENEYVLSEQKPAWSEEDENGLGDALWAIQQARTLAKDENEMGGLWYAENWLKSLKGRLNPKPKQVLDEDTQQWVDAIIKDYEELYNTNKDHRATIQAKISILKSLKDRVQPQQKQEWSKEDEEMFDAIIADIHFTQKAHNHEVNQVVYEREIDWLKSIKERYSWNPSDEHDDFIEKAIEWLKNSITNNPECNRIISKKGVITMGLLIEDFRTYMKGE